MSRGTEEEEKFAAIFELPPVARDLITGFVQEPWVKEMDWSTLERVRISRVDAALSEDKFATLWRVQHRDTRAFTYVIVVIQSTVDPFMSQWLSERSGIIREELLATGELPQADDGEPLLPPILPVVVHRGRERWTTPIEIEEPPDLRGRRQQRTAAERRHARRRRREH